MKLSEVVAAVIVELQRRGVLSEPEPEVSLDPEPEPEPESEPEPEPESDPDLERFESLKSAFVQTLGAGGAADDDALMAELGCSAAEFYAVLGELMEDGVVIEDGAGIRAVA